MAQATKTATEPKAPKLNADGTPRKPREESPFDAVLRVTISIHKDLADREFDSPMEIIAKHLSQDATLAVRPVQRERKKGAEDSDAPISQMVYIAPAGYEFPAEATGLRISQDMRAQLVSIAKDRGLTMEALMAELIASAAQAK